MDARRAQSTVEALALALGIAALFGGALALAPENGTRLVAAITSRIAPAPTPTASPGARAYARAALEPTADAPTAGDAVLRLAGEIGARQAGALLAELALTRHLRTPTGALEPLADPALALARDDLDGVGPARGDGAWSVEQARAAPSVRIAGADDEARWRAGLEPDRAELAVGAVAAGAASLFASLNPAAAAAVMGTSAAGAAGATPARGAPPGSRADDLLLCRPVWRTNHASADWRSRDPYAAARLRLGERVAALELVVVRAGRVITRALVWTDATRC